MKLPRWLVIGMLTLSGLLPLAAAGWWWVTWPERTAMDFAEILAKDDFREAFSRLQGQGEIIHWRFDPDGLKSAWVPSSLKMSPRTWSDFIDGRQRFSVGFADFDARPHSKLNVTLFKAVNGRVYFGWTESDSGVWQRYKEQIR